MKDAQGVTAILRPMNARGAHAHVAEAAACMREKTWL